MSAFASKLKKTMRPWLSDAPQVDGEQLVCIVRITLVALTIILLLAYGLTCAPELHASLWTVGISVSLWAALSGVELFLIKRSLYSPWLSLISVIADVLVVTGVQVALIMALPLNFVNGPITMLYFIIIGLAAIRKSQWLVKITGVASAIAHVSTTAISYYLFLPEGYLLVDLGGKSLELTFLDELGIGFVILALALIIAYVTKQLRESEGHYQSLFETVPDGIIIASSDRRILNVNHRFEEMLGLPKDRILGHSVIEFLGQSLSTRSRTPTPSGIFGAPTTLHCPGGIEVPIRTVAMPVEYKEGLCVEMSVRDVTDQIKLQRQLLQSQKMKTIGKLAGGLAHDFNNILGGILGATSLAEISVSKIEDVGTKEKLKQHIAVIQDCGEQARDIVSRLLTFSRTSALKTEPLDLNTLAKELCDLCRSTFDDNITITMEGTITPLAVEGDSISLRQAVLNLCINARDAMPEGGELNIKISEITASDDLIKRLPDLDPTEDYCCISVSDTGVGMDNKAIERIFEPFYTTKPVGKGTGLGLSMVFIIARQHGGCVEVVSSPGEGSTFHLYLTRSRASLLPAEPVQRMNLPRGDKTILIVDDDESVRSTVHEMLTQLGYKVHTAVHGLEALKKLDDPDCKMDLVLLDMVMPVMDGRKTLQEIRKRGNEVRVVVTSGFLGDDAFGGIENYRIADRLKKPFTYEALASVVDQALKPTALK